MIGRVSLTICKYFDLSYTLNKGTSAPLAGGYVYVVLKNVKSGNGKYFSQFNVPDNS